MSRNPHNHRNCLPLIVLTLATTVAFVFSFGCSDSDDSTGPGAQLVTGSLVAESDCGGYRADSSLANLPDYQTGVIWMYDGHGTLTLQHNNAAFNCCPEFKCEITVSGSNITVQEKEVGTCLCLCLFDVDYQVIGLAPGTYNVKFVELHLVEGDEKLEFPITLGTSASSDTVIVDRNHYPWALPWEVEAGLVAFSKCGGFDSAQYAPDPSPDSNCIVYQYDVSNTLTITHQNATFNCCPDELLADISVTDNVIAIAESEYAPNPCDCVCPFDLVMRVTNLSPGEYTINVTSPYLSEAIRLEVDLAEEPSGYYCVGQATPH